MYQGKGEAHSKQSPQCSASPTLTRTTNQSNSSSNSSSVTIDTTTKKDNTNTTEDGTAVVEDHRRHQHGNVQPEKNVTGADADQVVNHNHEQEDSSSVWIRLDSGKEFSRLLYTNPVCFLLHDPTMTTATTTTRSAMESNEPKEYDDTRTTKKQWPPSNDATTTVPVPPDYHHYHHHHERQPEEESNQVTTKSVQVVSWLTATNNEGSFLCSLNHRRHTASRLLGIQVAGNDSNSIEHHVALQSHNQNQEKDTERNKDDDDDDDDNCHNNHNRNNDNPFFSLSVPIHGMEQLVLNVGSCSGRFGSKFSMDHHDREEEEEEGKNAVERDTDNKKTVGSLDPTNNPKNNAVTTATNTLSDGCRMNPQTDTSHNKESTIITTSPTTTTSSVVETSVTQPQSSPKKFHPLTKQHSCDKKRKPPRRQPPKSQRQRRRRPRFPKGIPGLELMYFDLSPSHHHHQHDGHHHPGVAMTNPNHPRTRHSTTRRRREDEKDDFQPLVFAGIQGCVAHLYCRLVQRLPHPQSSSFAQTNHKKDPNNNNDDKHSLVLAQVEAAYVHRDYWNPHKQLFQPVAISPSSKSPPPPPPPYLTFFGSQTFGYVTTSPVPCHSTNGNGNGTL